MDLNIPTNATILQLIPRHRLIQPCWLYHLKCPSAPGLCYHPISTLENKTEGRETEICSPTTLEGPQASLMVVQTQAGPPYRLHGPFRAGTGTGNMRFRVQLL